MSLAPVPTGTECNTHQPGRCPRSRRHLDTVTSSARASATKCSPSAPTRHDRSAPAPSARRRRVASCPTCRPATFPSRSTHGSPIDITVASRPTRHGGGNRSRNQTQDEAEAAFHLAITLVQLFSSGSLSRRP